MGRDSAMRSLLMSTPLHDVLTCTRDRVALAPLPHHALRVRESGAPGLVVADPGAGVIEVSL